jgi:hypothetical protein
MNSNIVELFKSPRKSLPLQSEAFCLECGYPVPVLLAGCIYICMQCGSHEIFKLTSDDAGKIAA